MTPGLEDLELPMEFRETNFSAREGNPSALNIASDEMLLPISGLSMFNCFMKRLLFSLMTFFSFLSVSSLGRESSLKEV